MEIKKEVLIDSMDGLYAVGQAEVFGKSYYFAASENRDGRFFAINMLTGELSELKGGMGGVMSILPDENNSIVCIEEFYPVFDSASSKVIRILLEEANGHLSVKARNVIAEVPYTHRISIVREEGEQYLAFGRLCKQKKEKDDWSSAGTMEVALYSDGATGSRSLLTDGIYKHHALFVKRQVDGSDWVYYGGETGAYRSRKVAHEWRTDKITDLPTSDITLSDLDGDGKDELAIIKEFHGNRVVIFDNVGGQYQPAISLNLNFGHVLWSGKILEKPYLIAGSRAGDKELAMYSFERKENGELLLADKIIVDKGQAPTQILVNSFTDYSEIVAANGGSKQLIKYIISR